ncbi:MAG TPA: universal stress protein [Kofleriaceae bacterium]
MTAVQIQRILVAVDFSSNAEAATSYALLLARALRASITLLHVVPVPPSMVGIVPGGSIEGDLATDMDDAARRLEALAETLRTQLAPYENDLAIDAHVVPSSVPAEAIVAYATRGFELIVMGTHGRSGWSHLVVGSVAEKVLRNAPCPVMTIRIPRT